jgi:hypothetical protein
VGRLDGYELRFHKRSKDGSAKADAFRTGSCGDVAWGVVYELPVSELRQLDKVEAGYKRVPIDIIMFQDYLERGSTRRSLSLKFPHHHIRYPNSFTALHA